MNCSLSKCSPNEWDLIGFLRSGAKEDIWTLTKTAKPNDLLFIGMSGPESGIYAVARVISSPSLTKSISDDYTRNPKFPLKVKWRSKIRIIQNLIDSPVFDKQLEQIQELV